MSWAEGFRPTMMVKRLWFGWGWDCGTYERLVEAESETGPSNALELREAARDDSRREGLPARVRVQAVVVEAQGVTDGEAVDHGAELGHVVARGGRDLDRLLHAYLAGHERGESWKGAAVEELEELARRLPVEAGRGQRQEAREDNGGAREDGVEELPEVRHLEDAELRPQHDDEGLQDALVLAVDAQRLQVVVEDQQVLGPGPQAAVVRAVQGQVAQAGEGGDRRHALAPDVVHGEVGQTGLDGLAHAAGRGTDARERAAAADEAKHAAPRVPLLQQEAGQERAALLVRRGFALGLLLGRGRRGRGGRSRGRGLGAGGCGERGDGLVVVAVAAVAAVRLCALVLPTVDDGGLQRGQGGPYRLPLEHRPHLPAQLR